jgi:hypothetical protein
MKTTQTAQMSHTIELPDNIELNWQGSALEIVVVWKGKYFEFLAATAVMLDGAFFYEVLGYSDSVNSVGVVVSLGMGIPATYWAIAGWLNRTYLKVRPGTLSVRHMPIPWPGSKEFSRLDIKQLYAYERIGPTKYDRGMTTYEVHVVTRRRGHQCLISGLETREQAMYIEQEIENHLAIEDETVRGELSD